MTRQTAEIICTIYRTLWKQFPRMSGELLVDVTAKSADKQGILAGCGPADVAKAFVVRGGVA
jgi:hypothetical protein